MQQKIRTDKAQSAEGLLSQAVVTETLIFTAGFIHMTPEGEMVEGSIEKMFKRVMMNIEEVLKAADSGLERIVKVTVYVTNMDILGELNKLYVEYFDEPMPAREAVCVKELPLGAQIEISVIAANN